MFNIKKLLGDKTQLSGIKMMLKGLGLDIESMIPQAETALIEWFKKMQSEAGAKLTAVGVLDDANNQFIIALYKTEGENLTIWREFPLKDFNKILENFENPKKIENDAKYISTESTTDNTGDTDTTGTTTTTGTTEFYTGDTEPDSDRPTEESRFY